MTAILELPVLDRLHRVAEVPAPHDLLLRGAEAERWRREAPKLPGWTLTSRQLCDLELLLTGAFAPLVGFLDWIDYDSVVTTRRLADGRLWPMPITLDVPESAAEGLRPGDHLALRHAEGGTLAVLELSDIFRPNPMAEAHAVFGTTDRQHPAVAALEAAHPVRLGGRVLGLELPPHRSFEERRSTPAEVRAEIARRGWQRVVGFQTRNPLHRAHVELIRRAAERVDANVLLHPVIGPTKAGDIDAFTRVRCYEAVLDHFPPGDVLLSLLPLAMRMGGPREALWHALIRRNYGCTHFIVGRDHAGPGVDSRGRPFYGPYEAQELVRAHAGEIGLEIVEFEELAYDGTTDSYRTAAEAEGRELQRLSGTELRRRLDRDEEIPAWFSYPSVIEVLRSQHRPRSQRGLTVFLTGLSGAGKSTVAHALVERLMWLGSRSVTLLDGDLVRQNLSSELGFSRAHRDLNIQRIGFVASEITKAGGIAVCAPIAPYAEARDKVRAAVGPHGGFFEVHVSTPLDVCESRDPKGLYARARAGEIRGFTGIDDPYEVPEQPELRLDTSTRSPADSAEAVIELLHSAGYLAA
ncbi:MAG: bifunctional sulfate adenylyltransferase/adenylylsulfate kinase [Acidobacteriota bacterium]